MTSLVHSPSIATLIVAALFGLTGCGSKILYAPFDADVVGTLPDSSLPGSPSGDQLWSTAGSDTTMLSVVNSPIFSSKSMRFVNDGPTIRYVGFFSKGISTSAHKFYAYWSGTMSPGSAPLDIWLGNTHFAGICGIRLENGNVRLSTGADAYETIGTYATDTSHVILFTVDKLAGTYDVAFLQSNHNCSRHNVPILNASALATPKPTLYLAYFGGGGVVNYVIDEVTITMKEPEM